MNFGEKLKVEHQAEKNRVVMNIQGQMARVDYRKRDGKLWLVHSEVPLNLRGKGYGKILVDKTLNKLTEENYKLVAVCPFIRNEVIRSARWKKIVEHM